MANGLSMKVLLQLQKQQFDKGISEVRSSISGLAKSVKSVAGILIGGMGLTALAGHFKDTAQQLSIVKATMENVSKGMAEYGDNMQFIKNIAKEYGQDMLSLSQGFAKFHAAAKTSNLSLDQQRDIFESLTRAAGAYHLASEQTANVMLAVEQMLSKGKVTAEELRRQLGNSLPGAFNIMAKAAGVSTAELDRLMKSGKVISEEVLPKFATELDIITAAANFDSLQSSMNRFRNAWTEFVDESGFEKFFKGVVDFGTKSLNTLTEHFDRFISVVTGGLAAIMTGKAFGAFSKEGEKAIKDLDKTTSQYQGRLKNLDKQISSLTIEGRKLSTQTFHLTSPQELTKSKALLAGITKEEWEAAKWANEALRTKSFIIDKQRKLLTIDNKINALEQQRDNLIKQQVQSQELLEMSSTKIGKAVLGVRNIVSSIWTTMKSMLVSFAAGAIIGALTAVVTRLVQIAKEEKRIKNLVDDTVGTVEKRVADAYDKQVAKMELLRKKAEDTKALESQRLKALNSINSLLDGEKLTMQDIETNANKVTAAIDKWKQKILESARAAAYWDEIIIQQKKVIELERELQELEDSAEYKSAKNAYNGPYSYGSYADGAVLAKHRRLNEELRKSNELVDYYYKKIQEGQKGEHGYLWGDPNAEFTEAEVIDKVKEALDGYKVSAADLDKKLKTGAVSIKKYNRDLNKLREDTLKNIQQFDTWEDAVESLGGEYEKLIRQLQKTSNFKKPPIDTLKEDLEKYRQEKEKLDNTLASGKMTGEEYAKALEKLVNRFKDNIFGFENLEEMLNKLGQKYKDTVADLNESIDNINLWNEIEAVIKEQDAQLDKAFKESLEKTQKYYDKANEIIAKGIPVKKKRETNFFAYKDGLERTLDGQADDAARYVQELEAVKNSILELKKLDNLDPFMTKMLNEVIEKLKIAKREASALRDAANFAELAQDVEQLNKSLNSQSWEVWSSGIVGASGNIVNALQSINEVFDDALFDSEFLETVSKLISVFDNLNNIVETINNTFEMFNTITKTSAKLQEAQIAITQLQSGVKTKSLAAETVAEATSAAATQSAEAAKSAAINTTTTALANQAVVGAASSQASIPYVGPVLAAAAVAGIIGLIATNMNKFAKGGIVGGSKTQGDQNVIRANSGEMVLNKAQQANLFSMIKNGGAGGGSVEFKIRGADLVGTLNNYHSRLKG